MADQPYRVLIVEDDEDVAGYVRIVLQRRLNCDVQTRGSLAGVVELVREFEPDVVITDIELPGGSGLELLESVRRVQPALPVVVMTAHSSVDYAVQALRGHADEFLQKPVSATDLVAVVERLAEAFRRVRAASRKRSVLAIGAHPDDVEIGVGGTLSAHAAAGDPVTILTLSRGARGGDTGDRQGESRASAEMLGARLFIENLPDTRIPVADPTVGIIERVIAEVDPLIIYVHTKNERHQDHKSVHEATMIAARRVENVACYESPSTTIDFRPSRFVSIDGFTDAKMALLACFASQFSIRDYMEPEFVLAGARYWSRFGTARYVEALEVIRDSGAIGTPVQALAAAGTSTDAHGKGEVAP